MKIVAGMTLNTLKCRVIEQSLRTVNSPSPLGQWVEWFASQSCDFHGSSEKKSCEGCKDKCEGGKGEL